MSVLGFRRARYIEPDPTPAPEISDVTVQIEVTIPPAFDPDAEPACTCKAFDGYGQNPTCDVHPWWLQDPHALHLADLTRELGSALAAAQAAFGGGA